MSSASIKRHNHRVLPCDQDRKIELINFLIATHSDIDVAIISKEAINYFKDINMTPKVQILTDDMLDEKFNTTFEMMLHYDLPEDPSQYIKRLNFAQTTSLILLDPTEQTKLYPIETTLGRALVQDAIKQFETTHSKEQRKIKAKKEKKAKLFEKELAKEKEKKAQKAQKALPPKRTVRKIEPKSPDQE